MKTKNMEKLITNEIVDGREKTAHMQKGASVRVVVRAVTSRIY